MYCSGFCSRSYHHIKTLWLSLSPVSNGRGSKVPPFFSRREILKTCTRKIIWAYFCVLRKPHPDERVRFSTLSWLVMAINIVPVGCQPGSLGTEKGAWRHLRATDMRLKLSTLMKAECLSFEVRIWLTRFRRPAHKHHRRNHLNLNQPLHLHHHKTRFFDTTSATIARPAV